MPRHLMRWLAVLCAVGLLPCTAAYARQTESVQLRRADGKTSVVFAPNSVAPGGTLTVLCDQFDCREVQARVDLSGSELSPDAGGGLPNQRSFELPGAVKEGSKVQLRTCAAGMAPETCLKSRPVTEISFGQAGAGPGRVTRAQVVEFCSLVGAAQVREIRGRRGKDDFTVVLFDDTGPCFLSRQFGAEGDPIAIGFVSTGGATVSLTLDPCNTLAAAPKVLVSDDISKIAIQSSEDPRSPLRTEWFPPMRRCFGTEAGIKLSVTVDQTTKELAYPLKQFERYRATLQVGVGFSELHQQTFGLRQDGDVQRIYQTSETERGPEYVATVVLYGVPHYFTRRSVRTPCVFENLKKRVCPPAGMADVPVRENYFGRDPVNDNSALDRIGLMFGAGLSQPGRRFLIGGSFELLTGVNLFLTREFVRSPELEGVAVGDIFAGDPGDIPIGDHWRQAWTAGVSLDLRYAVSLFGRK